MQVKNILNFYPRWVCKLEFEQQSFKRYNERPVEFSFVFKHLANIFPLKILDIGTGTTALPHLMRNCGFLVTAIDNIKDYWPDGMFNRHYHVINDDITNIKIQDEFDLITCISVLEHIDNSEIAIFNMFNLLKPLGHLILTFPYSENYYVKNVYKLSGSNYGQNATYICQSFSRNEVEIWINNNGGEIIDQEFWQFWDEDFWTLGNQIIPPVQVSSKDKHQLSCLLIRKGP